MASKRTSGARSDLHGHSDRITARVRQYQQPGALDGLVQLEQEAAEKKAKILAAKCLKEAGQ